MVREVNEETKVKWCSLVQGLRNATDDRKISWAKTADDSAFITSLGDYVILLEKEEGERTKYLVKVQDSFGDLIDEFDDEDIDSGDFSVGYFSLMANLYLKIMRQVSGADAAIDEVLGVLKAFDENPF